MRYRDWLCVYADHDRMEKCRLEAHAVRVDGLHHSLMAWRKPDGSVGWIQVRSSLPMPCYGALQSPHGPSFKTLFQGFSYAINARYYQDLSPLPTYEQGQPVQRHNAAYYTDEREGHVLIVYSPTTDASAACARFRVVARVKPGAETCLIWIVGT